MDKNNKCKQDDNMGNYNISLVASLNTKKENKKPQNNLHIDLACSLKRKENKLKIKEWFRKVLSRKEYN